MRRGSGVARLRGGLPPHPKERKKESHQPQAISITGKSYRGKYTYQRRRCKCRYRHVITHTYTQAYAHSYTYMCMYMTIYVYNVCVSVYGNICIYFLLK